MNIRHLLAWPGLVATVSLTIYGNLTIAQPSAGGYISHATAPAIYLVLATLLLHSGEMHNRSRRYVYVGMAGIALIALVVSYDGLYTAAVHWGWDPRMAYAYPVLVDFGVLAFTAYLDGTRVIRPAIVEPQPEPDVIGVPVAAEAAITQPIDPGFTLTKDDEEWLQSEAAKIKRSPRGEVTPALRAAVDALLAGVPTAQVERGPGAADAVIGRYAWVVRTLRDNPNAPIDCKAKKVRPALVDEIRAAMRELGPR